MIPRSNLFTTDKESVTIKIWNPVELSVDTLAKDLDAKLTAKVSRISISVREGREINLWSFLKCNGNVIMPDEYYFEKIILSCMQCNESKNYEKVIRTFIQSNESKVSDYKELKVSLNKPDITFGIFHPNAAKIVEKIQNLAANDNHIKSNLLKSENQTDAYYLTKKSSSTIFYHAWQLLKSDIKVGKKVEDEDYLEPKATLKKFVDMIKKHFKTTGAEELKLMEEVEQSRCLIM